MVPLASSRVMWPQPPMLTMFCVSGPQLSPPGSPLPGMMRAVHTSLPVRRSLAWGSAGWAGGGRKPVAPMVMIMFL